MNYIHIAERIFNSPLLVHEGKLNAILHVLGPRMGVEMPILAQLDQAVPRAVNADTYDAPDGIRVIEVNGTLVNRYATAPSGKTSYDELRDSFRQAGADSKVRGVMLRLDSYGGEAAGLWDTIDELKALKSLKPVWASADEDAFSAAYALASQADRLYVTRSGGLGSVGVIAVHYDYSKYLDKEGIRPTAIFAGSRKNDFSPDAPLSPEATKMLRSVVDEEYSRFVDYVAEARRMKADQVKATEAGVFMGKNALDVGFADRIGTFDQALKDFSSHLSQTTSFGAQSATNTSAQGAHMEKQETQVTQPAAIAGAAIDVAAIRAEAVKAERERIAGILNLEESKGREPLARQLALSTDIGPEAAKAILAAAPKADAFGRAMAELGNPDVRPAPEGGGADKAEADSEVKKILALSGNISTKEDK